MGSNPTPTASFFRGVAQRRAHGPGLSISSIPIILPRPGVKLAANADGATFDSNSTEVSSLLVAAFDNACEALYGSALVFQTRGSGFKSRRRVSSSRFQIYSSGICLRI